MTSQTRSPADLRNMFGANLRQLSRQYPSISELSRQLGINRTQFNRYLSGESFPRPDVLDRICQFFEVDARILLEPVAKLSKAGQVINGAFLADFLGCGVLQLREEFFPSGFYRFTRRSFINDNKFVIGLVYVFRNAGVTYIKGFEAKEAMRGQGLPDRPGVREFRGYISGHEDGVAFVIARRNAMTYSFNYLARVASLENNFWSGYVARTIRENETGERVTRMVYEHLGRNTKQVLAAARSAGFADEAELLPFHQRLLQSGQPFR
ncbi:helix-turn-helix transcriptional regulator [Leisingera sp.]|uniref:helix-turn-helix domain-containing protein n=1 Tax=Leisingera sp. TaxID=1879318 RepID=UPI002B26F69D|nr:helix-turn-helix transcriptional regulator [Leisingera sp.]